MTSPCPYRDETFEIVTRDETFEIVMKHTRDILRRTSRFVFDRGFSLRASKKVRLLFPWSHASIAVVLDIAFDDVRQCETGSNYCGSLMRGSIFLRFCCRRLLEAGC